MSPPPLRFANVSFAYPGTEVFRNLNLSVRAGELTALLGPNGSGKTTMLRLATRVLLPRSGSVTLSGDATSVIGAREVARRVAVVPQGEGSLFAYSVDEVVLMGRTPWLPAFGFEGERDWRLARESLAAVDAEHLSGRDITQLSGGEWQRVLVARALAQEAGLLVLDEPTSHLDLKHQVAVLRLLRRLKDRDGLTVVVISHDVNLCSRFADRMVLLSDGKIRADGAPVEVVTSETLSLAYHTRVTVRPVEGLDVPQVFPD